VSGTTTNFGVYPAFNNVVTLSIPASGQYLLIGRVNFFVNGQGEPSMLCNLASSGTLLDNFSEIFGLGFNGQVPLQWVGSMSANQTVTIDCSLGASYDYGSATVILTAVRLQ
jgi:hypothetical protein